MWEAIRWYARNGYRGFCFGRTEPENKGLMQFKAGWGAEEYPIHYYKYDLKKNSYVTVAVRTQGFHNKIFENMPVPMLRAVGSLLYRHMG